jgi:predicted DNA-binding protein with PD1-like motif
MSKDKQEYRKWWEDDPTSEGFYAVEAKTGREFILRIQSGADVVPTIQKFAKKHNIKVAKIHAAYMGAFHPAKFSMYIPVVEGEGVTKKVVDFKTAPSIEENLNQVLSMSGIIQPNPRGGDPVVKIHFITGGAWDVPTTGGHLYPGSIAWGLIHVFITELLGLELIDNKGQNEDWFKEI